MIVIYNILLIFIFTPLTELQKIGKGCEKLCPSRCKKFSKDTLAFCEEEHCKCLSNSSYEILPTKVNSIEDCSSAADCAHDCRSLLSDRSICSKGKCVCAWIESKKRIKREIRGTCVDCETKCKRRGFLHSRCSSSHVCHCYFHLAVLGYYSPIPTGQCEVPQSMCDIICSQAGFTNGMCTGRECTCLKEVDNTERSITLENNAFCGFIGAFCLSSCAKENAVKAACHDRRCQCIHAIPKSLTSLTTDSESTSVGCFIPRGLCELLCEKRGLKKFDCGSSETCWCLHEYKNIRLGLDEAARCSYPDRNCNGMCRSRGFLRSYCVGDDCSCIDNTNTYFIMTDTDYPLLPGTSASRNSLLLQTPIIQQFEQINEKIPQVPTMQLGLPADAAQKEFLPPTPEYEYPANPAYFDIGEQMESQLPETPTLPQLSLPSIRNEVYPTDYIPTTDSGSNAENMIPQQSLQSINGVQYPVDYQPPEPYFSPSNLPGQHILPSISNNEYQTAYEPYLPQQALPYASGEEFPTDYGDADFQFSPPQTHLPYDSIEEYPTDYVQAEIPYSPPYVPQLLPPYETVDEYPADYVQAELPSSPPYLPALLPPYANGEEYPTDYVQTEIPSSPPYVPQLPPIYATGEEYPTDSAEADFQLSPPQSHLQYPSDYVQAELPPSLPQLPPYARGEEYQTDYVQTELPSSPPYLPQLLSPYANGEEYPSDYVQTELPSSLPSLSQLPPYARGDEYLKDYVQTEFPSSPPSLPQLLSPYATEDEYPTESADADFELSPPQTDLPYASGEEFPTDYIQTETPSSPPYLPQPQLPLANGDEYLAYSAEADSELSPPQTHLPYASEEESATDYVQTEFPSSSPSLPQLLSPYASGEEYLTDYVQAEIPSSPQLLPPYASPEEYLTDYVQAEIPSSPPYLPQLLPPYASTDEYPTDYAEADFQFSSPVLPQTPIQNLQYESKEEYPTGYIQTEFPSSPPYLQQPVVPYGSREEFPTDHAGEADEEFESSPADLPQLYIQQALGEEYSYGDENPLDYVQTEISSSPPYLPQLLPPYATEEEYPTDYEEADFQLSPPQLSPSSPPYVPQPLLPYGSAEEYPPDFMQSEFLSTSLHLPQPKLPYASLGQYPTDNEHTEFQPSPPVLPQKHLPKAIGEEYLIDYLQREFPSSPPLPPLLPYASLEEHPADYEETAFQSSSPYIPQPLIPYASGVENPLNYEEADFQSSSPYLPQSLLPYPSGEGDLADYEQADIQSSLPYPPQQLLPYASGEEYPTDNEATEFEAHLPQQPTSDIDASLTFNPRHAVQPPRNEVAASYNIDSQMEVGFPYVESKPIYGVLLPMPPSPQLPFSHTLSADGTDIEDEDDYYQSPEDAVMRHIFKTIQSPVDDEQSDYEPDVPSYQNKLINIPLDDFGDYGELLQHILPLFPLPLQYRILKRFRKEFLPGENEQQNDYTDDYVDVSVQPVFRRHTLSAGDFPTGSYIPILTQPPQPPIANYLINEPYNYMHIPEAVAPIVNDHVPLSDLSYSLPIASPSIDHIPFNQPNMVSSYYPYNGQYMDGSERFLNQAMAQPYEMPYEMPYYTASNLYSPYYSPQFPPGPYDANPYVLSDAPINGLQGTGLGAIFSGGVNKQPGLKVPKTREFSFSTNQKPLGHSEVPFAPFIKPKASGGSKPDHVRKSKPNDVTDKHEAPTTQQMLQVGSGISLIPFIKGGSSKTSDVKRPSGLPVLPTAKLQQKPLGAEGKGGVQAERKPLGHSFVKQKESETSQGSKVPPIGESNASGRPGISSYPGTNIQGPVKTEASKIPQNFQQPSSVSYVPFNQQKASAQMASIGPATGEVARSQQVPSHTGAATMPVKSQIATGGQHPPSYSGVSYVPFGKSSPATMPVKSQFAPGAQQAPQQSPTHSGVSVVPFSKSAVPENSQISPVNQQVPSHGDLGKSSSAPAPAISQIVTSSQPAPSHSGVSFVPFGKSTGPASSQNAADSQQAPSHSGISSVPFAPSRPAILPAKIQIAPGSHIAKPSFATAPAKSQIAAVNQQPPATKSQPSESNQQAPNQSGVRYIPFKKSNVAAVPTNSNLDKGAQIPSGPGGITLVPFHKGGSANTPPKSQVIQPGKKDSGNAGVGFGPYSHMGIPSPIAIEIPNYPQTLPYGSGVGYAPGVGSAQNPWGAISEPAGWEALYPGYPLLRAIQNQAFSYPGYYSYPNQIYNTLPYSYGVNPYMINSAHPSVHKSNTANNYQAHDINPNKVSNAYGNQNYDSAHPNDVIPKIIKNIYSNAKAQQMYGANPYKVSSANPSLNSNAYQAGLNNNQMNIAKLSSANQNQIKADAQSGSKSAYPSWVNTGNRVKAASGADWNKLLSTNTKGLHTNDEQKRQYNQFSPQMNFVSAKNSKSKKRDKKKLPLQKAAVIPLPKAAVTKKKETTKEKIITTFKSESTGMPATVVNDSKSQTTNNSKPNDDDDSGIVFVSMKTSSEKKVSSTDHDDWPKGAVPVSKKPIKVKAAKDKKVIDFINTSIKDPEDSGEYDPENIVYFNKPKKSDWSARDFFNTGGFKLQDFVPFKMPRFGDIYPKFDASPFTMGMGYDPGFGQRYVNRRNKREAVRLNFAAGKPTQRKTNDEIFLTPKNSILKT